MQVPCFSTVVIRHAIASRVHELGGDVDDLEQIVLAAAAAVFCSSVVPASPLSGDRLLPQAGAHPYRGRSM